MIDSLSIAVHTFVSRVSMSFSVDETLLTQFSCQKILFQAIQFSQTVLFQTIQFSIGVDFV